MFVPDRLFQSRPMFVSGAPEGAITRVGSGLTHKHWTRLERLFRDEHSSSLITFVNYGRKFFITLGHWPMLLNFL